MYVEHCADQSHPDVTICIATCNQLHYIQQCIESVLAQTGSYSWELLVGDDRSEDGTSEEIARLLAGHDNARHIRHDSRKGASANMQHLFANARGRYIAHLDGDDYWLPGKLQRQIEFLDTHPQCVAVYTNAIVVDNHGNTLALFNDAGNVLIDLATLLTRGNFLNNSSMMLRREQIATFNAQASPFLDFEGHLLHARAGLLGHIGEPLVAYRANAQGSLVATANDQTREMYLHGILGVASEEVPNSVRILAFADFLRRVVFRAVRTRDPCLLAYWWNRVTPHAPTGTIHLAASTAWAVATEGLRQAFNHIRRRPRVLYRS